ncbi:MAG TPA: GNAT family N-acetyltransferase [Blastocatellia bacterium]|nr:GNAT family N-acetyltransferase [Blastocatellia bacterium]
MTEDAINVVPLEEADLAGLESLFDEQCEEWLTLLKWDFTGPSRMIREVARQHDLAGFVAMSGGAMIGFSYYVIESSRCSIGDIYVTKSWRECGADGLMLAALLNRIERAPRVQRIESQCVMVGNSAAAELFEARGFTRYDRNYMMLDLGELNLDEAQSRATHRLSGGLADVSIRQWDEDDFAQAARVIHRSYKEQPDSRINSQYATEEGCAELLTILTDHIWCGEFLPQASRVAIRRNTRNLIGVLIASKLAAGAGHIGQISIHPSYQGMGLGRRMISSALAEFQRRGFNTASLAVTTANASALHLYESCGFRTVHTFPVFYRERR